MNDESRLDAERSDQDEHTGHDARWVGGQTTIFLISTFLPPLERLVVGPGYEIFHPLVTLVVGLLLIIAMFRILGRARTDLAENFRVHPTPISDGRLIDQGIYGWVRHPMYFSAVLGTLGWGLAWQSWSGLVMALVTYVFFTAKARYEERMLNRQYPGYADYRQRVSGRLIPLPRKG